MFLSGSNTYQGFTTIDGFVTAKAEPNDIDAVLLLPPDFQVQVERGPFGPDLGQFEEVVPRGR